MSAFHCRLIPLLIRTVADAAVACRDDPHDEPRVTSTTATIAAAAMSTRRATMVSRVRPPEPDSTLIASAPPADDLGWRHDGRCRALGGGTAQGQRVRAYPVRTRPGPGAALGRVPPAGHQDPGPHGRLGRLPAHPAHPLLEVAQVAREMGA